MNIVNYENYSPKNEEIMGLCAYFRDDLRNGQTLKAHANGGEKHPIHEDCIRDLVKNWREECPTCTAPVNVLSLRTFKEKCFERIKTVAQDALFGVAAAGVGTVVVLTSKMIAKSNFLTGWISERNLASGTYSMLGSFAGSSISRETRVMGAFLGIFAISGIFGTVTMTSGILRECNRGNFWRDCKQVSDQKKINDPIFVSAFFKIKSNFHNPNIN